MLHEHKTLFKAYGILEEQVRNYRKITRPFSKIGKSRPKRGIELIMIERGSQLPKELHAAKRKQETDTGRFYFLYVLSFDLSAIRICLCLQYTRISKS